MPFGSHSASRAAVAAHGHHPACTDLVLLLKCLLLYRPVPGCILLLPTVHECALMRPYTTVHHNAVAGHLEVPCVLVLQTSWGPFVQLDEPASKYGRLTSGAVQVYG